MSKINWSQESVEKVAEAIYSADDHSCNMGEGIYQDELAKAALSVIAELPEVKAQWQPSETAPKDGTRFLGAINWPSPEAHKRLKDIGGPAPGAIYHFAAVTYMHDGRWYIQNHSEITDQDSLYAWCPVELPPAPFTGGHDEKR